MEVGLTVLSPNGVDGGTTTGGQYRCRLEGCGGMRIAVRWPDGRVTYPCTKGMTYENDIWRIG